MVNPTIPNEWTAIEDSDRAITSDGTPDLPGAPDDLEEVGGWHLGTAEGVSVYTDGEEYWVSLTSGGRASQRQFETAAATEDWVSEYMADKV